MIRRGEIHWIAMDPTLGAEIKKTRPCLVISNNDNNHFSPLITILPITSTIKKLYPFEVRIPKGTGGLKEEGTIKANQIRTIDKKRVVGGPQGPEIDDALMDRVVAALKLHLDME